MSKTDIEAFFAPYDEIADAVVSDPTPRSFIGGVTNHVAIVDYVLQTCGIESFDIFGEVNWPVVYACDDTAMLLAYSYRAYFLYTVCAAANRLKVGKTNYSLINHAIGELWHKKLLDKFVAISTNKEVKHNWIH